jgi:hypothetical protein
MREAAEKSRRAASVLLDVTEKTIERWEDPEKPASLPNAAEFFRLVAFYGAQRKLLVLLGSWERRESRGGAGAADQRSRAGGV